MHLQSLGPDSRELRTGNWVWGQRGKCPEHPRCLKQLPILTFGIAYQRAECFLLPKAYKNTIVQKGISQETYISNQTYRVRSLQNSVICRCPLWACHSLRCEGKGRRGLERAGNCWVSGDKAPSACCGWYLEMPAPLIPQSLPAGPTNALDPQRTTTTTFSFFPSLVFTDWLNSFIYFSFWIVVNTYNMKLPFNYF